MTKDEINAPSLANGFTLRDQTDGTQDLNPYVYGFADALIAKVRRDGSEEGSINDYWRYP